MIIIAPFKTTSIKMSMPFNVLNDEIKESIERRHTHEPLGAHPRKAGHAALSVKELFSPAAGKIRLGFVGLSAGAGATTLCFAAAEYLAALMGKQSKRGVTMLELDMKTDAPAGMPYDKIGIDRRFAGREFFSFYKLAAEGRPLHSARNIDGGINWALRVPGEPGPLPDPAALHRLICNAAGSIILCDVSAPGILSGAGPKNGRDALKAVLSDLDHIICVFDPLPSRLLASVSAAEVCRAAASAGVPVTYVFNKLNAGVNLREATRFTGVRNYLPFPSVAAESVYAAEYACRSLATELKDALSALFRD